MNHDNYYEIYLQELEGIKACDVEETKALVEALQAGQGKACERLIEGHLHLIPPLVAEFENQGVATADLVQEANMGLTIVVMELGNGFSGDDVTAVLQERIRLALEGAVGAAKMEAESSEEILARVNVLKKVSQMMAKDLGREASLTELSEFMKMTEDEVRAIMKLTLDAMSVE